ncbi:MAG: hypothetical protein N2Z22_09555, partial [Turneriella sp.]|nr:hypothetical protein [Turneriella sp.]
VLPKSSAVVSSPNYQGQETINTDGYQLPFAFILDRTLWRTDSVGLLLGLGAGALFSSVFTSRHFGNASDYHEQRSLAPLLVARLELFWRWGELRFVLKMPLFWAEGRPIAEDSPAAPSFSGVGLAIGLGYQL